MDGYWSRFLGVPAAALRAPGVTVAPHAALAGWRGAWIFVRGESAVVSAPSDRLAALRAALASRAPSALASRAPAGLLDPELAASLAGVAREACVGPSFQGWIAPERFTGVAARPVRRLAASDRDALRGLRAACPPLDWEHAAVEGSAELFGCFEGSELIAVASLKDRGAGACDPGIVTHPGARGRGYGGAAVAHAVAHALAGGRVVLYQTLLANRPALRIAERLGFETYATLLAIRLEEAP